MVEGLHDIAFLKHISRMLHNHDEQLPDLAQLEAVQQLIFIPTGGDTLLHWVSRLAGLGLRAFHLYDREVSPATEQRQKIVQSINVQPGCVASLTSKRSLENYLHDQAVFEACGVIIALDDEADVPAVLVQKLLAVMHGADENRNSKRRMKRLRNRVKKFLSTVAVTRMTPDRLAARDPQQEVIGWLKTIASLLSASTP